MKPGPVGTFRARCNRLREDHEEIKERRVHLENLGLSTDGLPEEVICSETFDNFPDAEAHMKAVHPKAFRKQRRNPPKMSGARKRPYGAPAVQLDEQDVEPGARFITPKGHEAQVVGAVSSARTKILVWAPEGSISGKGTQAFRYWYLGPDENDLWTWEMTVSTEELRGHLLDAEEDDE